MSLADVVRFQVVTASLVDSHLAGLTTVPLTSKTPDTIFTLVTIRHLGGGREEEGRREGGEEIKDGRKREDIGKKERRVGGGREGGIKEDGSGGTRDHPTPSSYLL